MLHIFVIADINAGNTVNTLMEAHLLLCAHLRQTICYRLQPFE